MNGDRTEKTLTSDWDDLDSVPPKDSLQVGTPIGPYVVGELIGHGGMGVVYEAVHRATGAQVALKTLHRVGPIAQQRLKREFRSLCEVRHKNLVQLYELHTIDDSCFLTMEQIKGQTLKAYLSTSLPPHEFQRRLRELFQQLAEGLSGLHDEGLLHLDLKPDNVMVDDSGCPRILDFGLVETLDQRNDSTSHGGMAGTPRYMAPERRRGETATTATDWFSFGVMLSEFLIPGWPGPPAEAVFPQGTSTNLAQLCLNLMDDDPNLRPEGPEVAEYLGYRNSGKYLKRRTPSLGQREGPLAGRQGELDRLERLLSASRQGSTHWLHLSGESGVGKTALTRQFRETARARNEVLVLQGTCHERESMPFQGLDGVLDGLAEYLFEHQSALDDKLRRWADALEALSPAFADIARSPEVQPTDPLQRRRNAFQALKALLETISARRTVLVVLDDVQWGDGDGGRLLAEILAHPTSRRLFVVTTSRGEEDQLPAFVTDLEALLDARGTETSVERMHLTRLSDEQLLDCLPPSIDGHSGLHRDEIVKASRGLPFLARALSTHPWSAGQKPSLSALIQIRLKEAPPGALNVLRAVALSPSPLPQPVALETVGQAHLRHEVVAALRHAGLVRTAGESPDGPLEPYHALVAKTVQDDLGEESQQRLRLRLAQSLERKALASAELLANLFHLGGDKVTAARWAPIAAKDAERALAFDSAAHWYGRGAAWLPMQAADLLPHKARCLEFAGRSAAAAQAYEECALLSDLAPEKLTRAAGAAWLSAGHVDRGYDALAPELKALGTPISNSEKTALFRSLQLLWRLKRRGIEFEAQKEDECDALALERVDATWNAAKGLGIVMPLRGFALQLHCLLASLEAGEPNRVARSLSVVGPMFMGSPFETFGQSLIDGARSLVTGSGSAYLNGVFITFEAMAMAARWDHPEKILSHAEVAAAELKASEESTSWERGMAHTIGLRSREQLGRMEELQELARASLAESVDRDDLFAQSMAHQACAMSALAQCDTDAVRHHAQASVQDWSQATYTIQHYYALRYEVHAALLDGNAELARTLLLDNWKTIESAQFLRNPISRPELLLLRGTVELASARRDGRRKSSSANRMAKMLLKDPHPLSQAHGHLLQAACLRLKKKNVDALEGAKHARVDYDEAGLFVQAACAELQLAVALETPDQEEKAIARLKAMGVADPHRFARIHAPDLTFQD